MFKKNLKIILTLIIIIICLIGLFIISYFSKKIPLNPSGTVGNLAGNINNAGLFCEYQGRVYFANSKDNGKLYSMDVNEGNEKKLSDLKVRNILAGGKYLYFFQLGETGNAGIGNVISQRSFIRSDLDVKKTTSLFRGTVIEAQLVDNFIYMTTSEDAQIYFKKMKIDKSLVENLTTYEINPACARDGYIYYNGTQSDHYLYALNTENDVADELLSSGVWYPCIDGDYIYYMDIENNYRLCRLNLLKNEIDVLTSDRVDCFNVGYGYIYYQKNDAENPELICMKNDGSDKKTIAKGNYTQINMTSQYVYFYAYGDDLTTYHSLLGTDQVSIFKQ